MSLSEYIIKGAYLHEPAVKHFIVQKVVEDKSAIKGPQDLFKERRKAILESLDIGKLERSVTKSILTKKNSYSHKELIKISMELGKNFSETKSVLVEQLLKIKRRYDENMKY